MALDCVAGGAWLPAQAAIDAHLRASVGRPGVAATISFGTAALAIWEAATGSSMPAWTGVPTEMEYTVLLVTLTPRDRYSALIRFFTRGHDDLSGESGATSI